MGQISVIIPTLNAAGALRRSLPGIASLGALSMLREVIFADGGSSDETAAIAEAAGALFVEAPRG